MVEFSKMKYLASKLIVTFVLNSLFGACNFTFGKGRLGMRLDLLNNLQLVRPTEEIGLHLNNAK